MSSLIHSLPAPKSANNQSAYASAGERGPRLAGSGGDRNVAASGTTKFVPPPYGQRASFRPRTARDYGDGGAFPEVHVVQYPLDMGRKQGSGRGAANSKVVALTTDADGTVRHDAVVQKGSRKHVYSRHRDLVPAQNQVSAADLERPDEEQLAKTAAETQAALEKIVAVKQSAASATTSALARAAASNTMAPTYVRYTPSASASRAMAGAQTRVVRMVEQASDPLEPPKFKHKKVTKGPGSPPVPVMHSPPRKITAEDQQAWKIPPCVSNWKNAKGHAIPLHIRLAADGRGLQETQISDKFATLAQSMLHAERMAREEINKRAQIRQALAMKEKEAQEETLRQMAMESRLMRAGAGGPAAAGDAAQAGEGAAPGASAPPAVAAGGGGGGGGDVSPERVAAAAAAGDPEREERERIREERRRERQRANRMEAMGAARKAKVTRDDERDVSERVALGLQAAPKASSETQYDQRLFNQSAGLDSGFGDESAYNVYDKPLFANQAAQQIYRPRSNRSGGAVDQEDFGTEEDLNKLLDGGKNKFQPAKDFSGVDRSVKQQRDGPVEFERVQEEDPFGLDKFLQQAKSQKRSTEEPSSTSAKRSKH